MEKQIEFDGYTVAVIKKRYPNGDCLCDLIGDEKSDTNIVFKADNLPFELTPEEIEFLNPKYTPNPIE